MSQIHDPSNGGQKIDAVWLFISVDETGEGVCAVHTPNGMMPLIAADEARLKDLSKIAGQVAQLTKKKIKLIKLTAREECEQWNP